MLKIFYSVLASFTVLCIATACDENNIGGSIIDSESTLVIDSAYTITAESELYNNLPARTQTQLLGSLKSEEYGALKSDFVTQFMPASSLDTIAVDESTGKPMIDSLRFMLKVPVGSYMGDSITPMKVNVYKLNKTLPYPIYSDFDPSGYYDKADLIGSQPYTMTALNNSSIKYTESTADSDGNYPKYMQIVVKMPNDLAHEFYNKYMSSPATFNDPTAFAEYFPGVYATTSFGDGRIVKVTLASMRMNYKIHSETSAGNDTIISSFNDFLGIAPEIVVNNNIKYTPSETIEQGIENGDVYITAPAGHAAKISIPFSEIVSRFNKATNEGQTVLNSVELTIPGKEIKNDYGIDPPTNLLLVRASQKDKFFSDNKMPDGEQSFYTSYDTSTDTYTFSSLRPFVKAILDKDADITADSDYDTFYLVPVDVKTTTTTSYYTGTTTVLQSVNPMLSAPAMVKLDMGDAKLKVTYSKKNYAK